jgi:hypothetical protein
MFCGRQMSVAGSNHEGPPDSVQRRNEQRELSRSGSCRDRLRELSGLRVEYAEGAGFDPRSYRVGFSKPAETLRDATPSWTARDGGRELVDAVRLVGLTSRSFDSYTRLLRLKSFVDAGSLDDGTALVSQTRARRTRTWLMGSCPSECS